MGWECAGAGDDVGFVSPLLPLLVYADRDRGKDGTFATVVTPAGWDSSLATLARLCILSPVLLILIVPTVLLIVLVAECTWGLMFAMRISPADELVGMLFIRFEAPLLLFMYAAIDGEGKEGTVAILALPAGSDISLATLLSGMRTIPIEVLATLPAMLVAPETLVCGMHTIPMDEPEMLIAGLEA